jgi:glycosyltransferase involved in cell wall biosynthesis
MTKPLVSVFMPAYNQVEFVAEALQSAIDQDYPNLQVVAGDDSSTDGTAEIIMEYAHKYPDRVTPIVGEPHLGITRNCNRVLKACTGKYIAFHAGDDVYLPGKISTQVEWLEADERRVLCGHDVEAFDSDTGRRLYLWSKVYGLRRGWGADLIVRYHVPYGGVTVMLRAAAMPAYGYDERVAIISDWKLWIDCLAGGGYFGYVEGIYARYRRHAQSLTARIGLDREAQQASLRDHLLVLDLVEADHPELAQSCNYARASVYRWQASYHLVTGNRRAAFRWLIRSFRQRPQTKALLTLVLALGPTHFAQKILRV